MARKRRGSRRSSRREWRWKRYGSVTACRRSARGTSLNRTKRACGSGSCSRGCRRCSPGARIAGWRTHPTRTHSKCSRELSQPVGIHLNFALGLSNEVGPPQPSQGERMLNWMEKNEHVWLS